MQRKHVYKEAFMLMKYASRDGRTVEMIWNSRDGITPFVVHSKDGVEMSHVDWNRDQYLPAHKPKPGDRIFVDLTIEKATAYATARVERGWDHPEYPMREVYETKEKAIERLSRDMVDEWRPGGAPDLVEVA